jgi:hypothetical protein
MTPWGFFGIAAQGEPEFRNFKAICIPACASMTAAREQLFAFSS